MKQVLTPIFFCFVATACCAGSAESVAWYRTHDKERLSVLEKCKQDINHAIKSESCLNADQAEDQKIKARRGWPKPAPLDRSKKGA